MEITRPKPRSGVLTSTLSIPVSRVYLYLVAIMDWATRKVLSWRVSNTSCGLLCRMPCKRAIGKYGQAGRNDTDQEASFSQGPTNQRRLTAQAVRVSMDGAGATWTTSSSNDCGRSAQYEAVYLQETIADGFGLPQRVIDELDETSTSRRPHSALGKATRRRSYGNENGHKKAA